VPSFRLNSYIEFIYNAFAGSSKRLRAVPERDGGVKNHRLKVMAAIELAIREIQRRQCKTTAVCVLNGLHRCAIATHDRQRSAGDQARKIKLSMLAVNAAAILEGCVAKIYCLRIYIQANSGLESRP